MSVFKAALATLGCKVNQYETQFLREQFREAGFILVPFKEEADLYLINTCSVTRKADQKSKDLIRQAKRRNKRAFLVVTGCYAQAEKGRIKEKFSQVDLVIGNEDKLKAGQIIESYLGKCPSATIPPSIHGFDGHNRAFIKVEDGCNQLCAYCIIPYLRGKRIRSRSPEEIFSEVKNLVNIGFKEIVLAGINLGLYGRDLKPRVSLVDLLKRMEFPKLRIRLSSLEPHLIKDELIDLMTSSSRICPHLHIPLQSGDSHILERMGRRYTPDQYRELVRKVREKIPCLAITSDVLVGFPGEEESHFLNSYRFIEEMGFSRLHVFRFSPRPGTQAYGMRPQVEERVKRERSKKLRELGKSQSQNFISRFLGSSLRVLIEGKRDARTGLLTGYTDNYIRVLLKGGEDLKNQLIRVRLSRAYPGWALGEVDGKG